MSDQTEQAWTVTPEMGLDVLKKAKEDIYKAFEGQGDSPASAVATAITGYENAIKRITELTAEQHKISQLVPRSPTDGLVADVKRCVADLDGDLLREVGLCSDKLQEVAKENDERGLKLTALEAERQADMEDDSALCAMEDKIKALEAERDEFTKEFNLNEFGKALAKVKAERDDLKTQRNMVEGYYVTASDKRDALEAERDALQAVVDAARPVVKVFGGRMDAAVDNLEAALAALDSEQAGTDEFTGPDDDFLDFLKDMRAWFRAAGRARHTHQPIPPQPVWGDGPELKEGVIDD